MSNERRLGFCVLLLLWCSAAEGATLKSRDHTTNRAGVKLSLAERWNPSDEAKWKTNGRVILLVHGATWSSRCTFDPQANHSLMEALAQAGWDVWTVDLHGYGSSSKNEIDWTEAPSGANDVETAVDYIRAFRWVEKVHVFGYQWGGQVAGLFAIQKPNKVASLALLGMRYRLFDSGPEPTAATRTNSFAAASLKPDDGDLDQNFSKARAEVCMLHDPLSPSGAIIDLHKPSAVAPERITVPTLLIEGEHDGDDAQKSDRFAFFRALGTRVRSYVSVANLGKYAFFEKERARFITALLGFLNAQ